MAILLALSFLLSTMDMQETNKLLSVRVVQRHGDRYPLINLPNMTQYDTLGQLTKEGLEQITNRGIEFQAAYQDLLGNSYLNGQYTFYATHIDRTRMTTAAFAHGLFLGGDKPKYEGKEIFTQFKNQPVPLQSVSEMNEYQLLAASRCPNARSAVADHQQSPTIQNKYKEKKDLIATLINKTGYSAEGYDITNVIDYLIYLDEHDMTHPNITNATRDEAFEFFHWQCSSYAPLTNPQFCPAATGYFMVNHLKSSLSEAHLYLIDDPHNPQPVLHHMGGHDWSLNSIFRCLGYTGTDNPYYGSMMVIETYLNTEGLTKGKDVSDDELKSRLSYKMKYDFSVSKTGASLNLEDFTPTHCAKSPCSFADFSKPWSKYLGDSNSTRWFKEVCGWEEKGSTTGLIVTTVALACLFFASLVIAAILCIYYLRIKHPQQHPIN